MPHFLPPLLRAYMTCQLRLRFIAASECGCCAVSTIAESPMTPITESTHCFHASVNARLLLGSTVKRSSIISTSKSLTICENITDYTYTPPTIVYEWFHTGLVKGKRSLSAIWGSSDLVYGAGQRLKHSIAMQELVPHEIT